MADPVIIPDEVKQQIGNVAIAQVTGDDPFSALAGLNEEISPPVVEVEEVVDDEASPASKPAEEVATPPVITHPPELIERATALMIPANEVAEMSTAELQRVIKHADRVGQAVNDFHAQTKQQPAPETPTVVDDLAVLDDPEKYDPEFIKPIKAILADVKKELKAKDERIAQLEKKTQAATQQTLHQRLMTQATEIVPEIAKAFDLATKDGQAKYQELLDKMGLDQRYNKSLTEKQLVQRAVKAMELVPEKLKEAPETVVAKKRWNDNALAQPNSRKGKESLEDIVGKILSEAEHNDPRGQKRTNGQAAKLPQ